MREVKGRARVLKSNLEARYHKRSYSDESIGSELVGAPRGARHQSLLRRCRRQNSRAKYLIFFSGDEPTGNFNRRAAWARGVVFPFPVSTLGPLLQIQFKQLFVVFVLLGLLVA